MERDDLMELIRRSRRSIVECRRTLLSSSQLLHEHMRLRYLSRNLFGDIADLTRAFAEKVERRKSHPAGNRN
jgi:hypothetical protein